MNRNRIPGSIIFLSAIILLFSQATLATFSIVAVDTVTGEVGSVGASCIDTTMSGLRNLRIDRISEIVPGRGAINGQQSWAQTTLALARTRMIAGDSPAQIMAMLMQPQNNPQIYQYLIIDIFNGHPRDTAFTGSTGTNYKNHIIGRDFALAGNCLMGQLVLDSMRNAFVRSKGLPLPDRLMAGILGAKFAGADYRCINQGLSSLSAYIRVAKPNDSNYLHIAFGKLPAGVEPLEELKKRFDAWKRTAIAAGRYYQKPAHDITVGRGTANSLILSFSGPSPDRIGVTDLRGRAIEAACIIEPGTAHLTFAKNARGLYLISWHKNRMMLGTKPVTIMR
jgi:uncharacterized Ntn-hydrolase superfamily protein